MAKYYYKRYEPEERLNEEISSGKETSPMWGWLRTTMLSRVDPLTYNVISWVGHPAYTTGSGQLNEDKIVGACVRYKEQGGIAGLSSNQYMKVENTRSLGAIQLEGRVYTKISTYYVKGRYLNEVVAEEGTLPDNARHIDGYWYVKDRLANTAPEISGSNADLGSKTSDFEVEYIVTDTTENDSVKVEIYVNDILKETKATVSLGYKYKYLVKLSELSLGNHTVKIVATDSHKVTAERVYSFTKSNTAPVITSTQGTDLGEKNTAFSYVYQVYDANNDNVNVTISLNGIEINNLTDVPQNENLTITISDDMINTLEVGKINQLTIRADDKKGGITYRRITFIRTNRPPIISDSNRDLGIKEKAFNVSISATDVEKDDINLSVFIDDKLLKNYGVIVDNKVYQIQVTHDEFIKLSPGKHEIKVVATDSQDASSERLLTFTRKVTKLDVVFEINETDIRAEKILFTPTFKNLPDTSKLTVLATNNYFDTTPNWEDITQKALVKQVHVFANTTKTATKWGIAVKVIYDDPNTTAVLTGMTGGYE